MLPCYKEYYYPYATTADLKLLISPQDGKAKHFLYRHWRTCFELLDEDGSKAVSRSEFETLGFLFGFSRTAVKRIYDEFDVSGNQVRPTPLLLLNLSWNK